MTLTMGTGPFGEQRAGVFNAGLSAPEHLLYFEPIGKRVRASFGGETVADSTRVWMLHETGHLPVYYFPFDDVCTELLERSDHVTHCPVKGDASYWTLAAGERRAENAVWAYERPIESASWLAGHVAFYWDAVDAWFEEDEQVFVHPRDPYHRIDVLASSRHVRVSRDGELLAESWRPRLLFETGLPVRYYLSRQDVRHDLLAPSMSVTRCPYKGVAEYWSVRVGDDVVPDLVWTYAEPLHDALAVRGMLCFYNEQVDVEVDGQREQRPTTPFA
ncbi:MAG: DUF427 domain-containing protein [Actinophytocola sp.]|nr:DUF427 domain-containing protein [Actinophytocola sp.]